MLYCINSIQAPDLKRPLDKRVYRSPTVPVCHDFNLLTRSTSHLDLVVGFSTGPLQYLNPIERQAISAYNEDVSTGNYIHVHVCMIKSTGV